MHPLTLNLQTSAALLGTDPEQFLKFIQMEKTPGVLFFSEQPQVSIFTLAQLLNTSPEILLNWLEDAALVELIEEVDGDEWFDREEGQAVYQAILAEES
jgi:hypothetical protein